MFDDFKIYFAHPEFTDEQKEKAKYIEKLLHFYNVINPFSYTSSIENDTARTQIPNWDRLIFRIDKELVENSNLVIALMDDNDSGTMVEIGIAVALGIPVISICFSDQYINPMISGAVLAHIPNLADNSGMLLDIVSSTIRTFSL
jgi:nucleoside 2-deoxyribosyltransferase